MGKLTQTTAANVSSFIALLGEGCTVRGNDAFYSAHPASSVLLRARKHIGKDVVHVIFCKICKC